MYTQALVPGYRVRVRGGRTNRTPITRRRRARSFCASGLRPGPAEDPGGRAERLGLRAPRAFGRSLLRHSGRGAPSCAREPSRRPSGPCARRARRLRLRRRGARATLSSLRRGRRFLRLPEPSSCACPPPASQPPRFRHAVAGALLPLSRAGPPAATEPAEATLRRLLDHDARFLERHDLGIAILGNPRVLLRR